MSERRYDVNFELSSGAEYSFMLAQDDGKKAWLCKRINTIAPSLVKYRIEMTLTAREKEPNRQGTLGKKIISAFLTELETIAAETTAMTLTGLDGRTYSVIVDETGVGFKNIIEEKLNRKPEYEVAIICWGLWS